MKRASRGVAFWLALSCGCAFLLCAQCLYANRSKNGATQNAEALFARAKALTDMMAPGTPPYLLRIRVVGVGQLATYGEGVYSAQFFSPSEFKRDRDFGDWHFSAGANGDTKNEWLQSADSPPGMLEEVFMLSLSYAYGPTALQLPDKPHIKITQRNFNGVNLSCVEIQETYDHEVCFDDKTGAVFAVRDDAGLVFQYGDFQKWGAHLVPGEITAFAESTPIMRANVEVLESLPSDKSQASFFGMPTGTPKAEFRKTCRATPARTIAALNPEYPRTAGRPHNTGVVVLLADIDKTGRIADTLLVQSAGPDFDEAALSAVEHWRYSPATACGRPTASTTTIRVQFH